MAVLDPSCVVLSGAATTAAEAITEAGGLLVGVGAVDPSYVAAMHEREASVSTYMGNFLAIPHGTNEAKPAILRSAMCFIRHPEGIDWNGSPVEFVIGIAGAGDDHLELLSQVAMTFSDEAQIAKLRAAGTVEQVLDILAGT